MALTEGDVPVPSRGQTSCPRILVRANAGALIGEKFLVCGALFRPYFASTIAGGVLLNLNGGANGGDESLGDGGLAENHGEAPHH